MANLAGWLEAVNSLANLIELSPHTREMSYVTKRRWGGKGVEYRD